MLWIDKADYRKGRIHVKVEDVYRIFMEAVHVKLYTRYENVLK
jgi:hypothetical protein